MDTKMTALEERIRAAKTVAPPLPGQFTSQVMDQIARQGLAVLPAGRLRLKRWFCLGAASLLLVLGVLVADGLAYEVRMNGSLELLFFGVRFLEGFLAGLPLDLLFTLIALASLAAWLVHVSRPARLALVWVLLISHVLTGAGGLALAQSSLNEKVRDWATRGEEDLPLLGPYFRQRAHFRSHHPGFRMGKVIAIKDGEARMLTPAGEEVSVALPPRFRPRPGDTIRLGGRISGKRFRADKGQLCEPGRVKRYFHRMKMRSARGPGNQQMGMPMRMDPGKMRAGNGMPMRMGSGQMMPGSLQSTGMGNANPNPVPER